MSSRTPRWPSRWQAEVDLASRRIIGVEALVRWYHPVRGLHQPESFISIAVATNLAGELGRWVLHQTCRQHVQWRAY
ncbi:MAG: EAL domain-containing protein [Mycobacteriaceae bacterium]